MKFKLINKILAGLVLSITCFVNLAHAGFIRVDFTLTYHATLEEFEAPLNVPTTVTGSYITDDSLVIPYSPDSKVLIGENYNWLELDLGGLAFIGETSFDTSNVGVNSLYYNNNLVGIWVGIKESVGGIASFRDDFHLSLYDIEGASFIAFVDDPDISGDGRSFDVTRSFQSRRVDIPEPNSIIIMALGLYLIGSFRYKKMKRAVTNSSFSIAF